MKVLSRTFTFCMILFLLFLDLSREAAAQGLDFVIVDHGDLFSPVPRGSFRDEYYNVFFNDKAKGLKAFTNLKILLEDLDTTYFSHCSTTRATCRFLDEENKRNHLKRARELSEQKAQEYKVKTQSDLSELATDRDRLAKGEIPVRPDLKDSVRRAIAAIKKDAGDKISGYESQKIENETIIIPQLKSNVASQQEKLTQIRREIAANLAETKSEVEERQTPEVEAREARLAESLGDLASMPELNLDSQAVQSNKDSQYLTKGNYDTTQIRGELVGRGQAYLAEGMFDQGQRLIERANTYENFKKGASLPYQAAQLSSAAAARYKTQLRPDTFQNYENIQVFNAFAGTPRIMQDEYFDFQAAIFADNLLGTDAEANPGRYLAQLEAAWSLVDFGRGFGLGMYESAKGTVTGAYHLIVHPIDSAVGLGRAIWNYDKTWDAIRRVVAEKFQDLANCGAAAQACGEVSGLITGEVTQVIFGGALIKAGSGLIRSEKMLETLAATGQAASRRLAQLTGRASKLGFDDAAKFGELVDDAAGLAPCLRNCSFSEKLAGTEKLLDSARKWDSVESLLHVAKGNYQIAADGTRQLVSGMHTKLGFDNFLKLNQNAGKTFGIQNVTSFTAERIEARGAILSQTLDNGVKRIQLPRDAWANSDSFNKALAYTEAGQRVKGVKSLFPESWDVSRIAEAVEAVKNSPSSIVQGNSITGSFDAVKITMYIDSEGKILTSFPTWVQ